MLVDFPVLHNDFECYKAQYVQYNVDWSFYLDIIVSYLLKKVPKWETKNDKQKILNIRTSST